MVSLILKQILVRLDKETTEALEHYKIKYAIKQDAIVARALIIQALRAEGFLPSAEELISITDSNQMLKGEGTV